MVNSYLKFAEQYAEINKYTSIRLDAFSKNNRSLNLYEKNKYEKVGEVKFRKGLFYCYEKYISRDIK